MPSRVAFFLSSLNGGGVQRVMLNLARGLIARNVNVDLVLASCTGELLKQVPAEVRVVDLRAGRSVRALFPLYRYLVGSRPNALMSAQTHNNIVAICARRLTRTHTRLVISEHNLMSAVARQTPSMKESWRPLAARFFYPLADEIVAVSRGVADDLSRVAGLRRDRIRVVSNPIFTPELVRLAAEPIRHPWFVAGQPPVIVAVGRLATQKDYPTLLKAFSLVRKTGSVRLLILGEGEQRQSLERMVTELGIGESVLMPGFVQNPFPYIANAALLVLSSAWEGFANVLVEALACGTPVVSTDCRSGPREILESGRYGRLVEVGDPSEMAAAISATLQTPTQTSMLRRRAADFSLAAITDDYETILLR
jgi:glycosyltransferase involved in cell wall biosynthesis